MQSVKWKLVRRFLFLYLHWNFLWSQIEYLRIRKCNWKSEMFPVQIWWIFKLLSKFQLCVYAIRNRDRKIILPIIKYRQWYKEVCPSLIIALQTHKWQKMCIFTIKIKCVLLDGKYLCYIVIVNTQGGARYVIPFYHPIKIVTLQYRCYKRANECCS